MTEFVQIILSNLMQLMPFRIVRSYERGVRWTFGRNPVALDPGLRWCIWFRHSTEIFAVVDFVLNLPTQSVRTKDGKEVVFSSNITLRIADPVKHYCAVQDFKQSVSDLAMTHLHRKIRGKVAADIDLTETERQLKATLGDKLKEWGGEVLFVGFTDFVETGAQVRLFQDPTRQGAP